VRDVAVHGIAGDAEDQRHLVGCLAFRHPEQAFALAVRQRVLGGGLAEHLGYLGERIAAAHLGAGERAPIDSLRALRREQDEVALASGLDPQRINLAMAEHIEQRSLLAVHDARQLGCLRGEQAARARAGSSRWRLCQVGDQAAADQLDRIVNPVGGEDARGVLILFVHDRHEHVGVRAYLGGEVHQEGREITARRQPDSEAVRIGKGGKARHLMVRPESSSVRSGAARSRVGYSVHLGEDADTDAASAISRIRTACATCRAPAPDEPERQRSGGPPAPRGRLIRL
jgi:hypothetical protein